MTSEEASLIKNKRRQRYSERQEELLQKCRNCTAVKGKGPWYCEDCTTGIKLHLLDAEYADVVNWWSEKIKNQLR